MQEKWTNREYLVRLGWLREQWNRPTRTDHYILRLIWEVHYLLAKTKPRKVDTDLFKPQFGPPGSVEGEVQEESEAQETIASREYQTAMSKTSWGMRLRGATVKVGHGDAN